MDLRALADRRTEARGGANRRRQWTADYEYVGLKGEVAVTEALGCPLNTEISTPGGDGGIDTHVVLNVKGEATRFPIQIKCSRKPKNLPVEEGRAIPRAIYILCRFDDATDKAECLGWEWGSVLGKAPVGDIMGYGVPYHHIPRGQIRKMDELKARLWMPTPAPTKPAWTPFVPRCEVCNAIGHYGLAASGSASERWFCREHREPWERKHG